MAINREKVVAAAQKYIQKGQYKRAIKEYRRIVKEQPDDVRTLQKIGDLHARDGAIDDAVATYNEVADHYVAQGFFLKAVAVYKQLLRIAPGKLEARLRLADLYVQLSLLRDALQNYQEVADHYLRMGWIDAYLGTLERIVEVDPENAGNRILFGEQLLKYEHPDLAAEQFAAASDLLRAAGRYEEYTKVAERYIHLVPHDTIAVHALVRVYLEQDRAKRALSRIQTVFRDDPTNEVSLDLLVRALDALGERSRALTMLVELARTFEEEDAPEARRIALEKVLELDPSHAEAAAALGRAPGTAIAPPAPPGPSGAAIGEAARPGAVISAITMTPEPLPAVGAPEGEPPPATPAEQLLQIEKLLSETDVYLKYDLHDKALEHLNQVFTIDPNHLGALERRKSALVAKGDTELAVQVLIGMARIAQVHDEVQANLYLHQALAIVPDHPNVLAVLREFETGEPVLDEPEEIVVVGASEELPAPPVEGRPKTDELDALFDEFGGEDSGVGHRALDEDADFIAEVASSISDTVGDRAPAGTSANLIALDADDLLPAELDAALSKVRELTEAGEFGDARGQLFELLGEWPGYDEQLLRMMDELPSETDEVAAAPDDISDESDLDSDALDALVFEAEAELDAEGDDSAEVDAEEPVDDLFLLDEEPDAVVTDNALRSGRITGSLETASAGDYIAGVLDSADHEAVRDASSNYPATEEIEIVVEEWDDEDDGEAEFEVLDDAAMSALRDVEVDAEPGRPSAAVTRSFAPSDAALNTGDSDLAEAIRQRRAGNGMMAIVTLQDEMLGDHPVAASFELALANMEMGLYVDGISALERLLGDPTMGAADRLVVHYHIGIGYEALHQPGSARQHFERVRNADPVGFPDVATRLERIEQAG